MFEHISYCGGKFIAFCGGDFEVLWYVITHGLISFEALSTRIRIFLKAHLSYPYKKYPRPHEERFEKVPVHTKMLLHATFDVRSSIKEKTDKQNALA